MIDAARITENGKVLEVDHNAATLRFHAIWLRDNSPTADTRDPGNGQRLITMANLPLDTVLTAATSDGETVNLGFAPDHSCSFSADWLV